MKELLVLLLWVAVICMEAFTDSYADDGEKKKQHLFQALYILGYFVAMASLSYWEVTFQNFLLFYLLLYVTTRIFLFDLVVNKIMGFEIFYIGRTALWDRFIHRIGGSPVMWRFVFFCIWICSLVGVIYNFTL